MNHSNLLQKTFILFLITLLDGILPFLLLEEALGFKRLLVTIFKPIRAYRISTNCSKTIGNSFRQYMTPSSPSGELHYASKGMHLKALTELSGKFFLPSNGSSLMLKSRLRP